MSLWGDKRSEEDIMRKTHNSHHATHQLVSRTELMSYELFVRLAEVDKIKRTINRADKLAKRAICP